MPFPQNSIPAFLLEKEMLQLIRLVPGGKRTGQEKTQLAALIFEAKRTKVHLEWGFPTLGKYTKLQLGMNSATFAKYKYAGKALYDRDPNKYQALMSAIVENKTRPQLPPISKLAAMPSSKQPDHDGTAVGIFRSNLRIKSARDLAKMRNLQDFGWANKEGRKALSAIDDTVQRLSRISNLLSDPPEDLINTPKEILARRATSIRQVCAEVLQALTWFETDHP